MAIELDGVTGAIARGLAAVFRSEASARAGYLVKGLGAESAFQRSLDECGKAGLKPVEVILAAFEDLPTEICMQMFGVPYPPYGYIASAAHLRSLALRCFRLAATTPAGRMAEANAIKRALQDEYLSRRLSGPGLASAIITGTLSATWAALVVDGDGHPKHIEVKALCTRDDELRRRLERARAQACPDSNEAARTWGRVLEEFVREVARWES